MQNKVNTVVMTTKREYQTPVVESAQLLPGMVLQTSPEVPIGGDIDNGTGS